MEEEDWAWKALLMLLLLLHLQRGILGAQERPSEGTVSLQQMRTWLWMVPCGLCESAIQMWGFSGRCGRGGGEGVCANGLEVCLFLIGQHGICGIGHVFHEQDLSDLQRWRMQSITSISP